MRYKTRVILSITVGFALVLLLIGALDRWIVQPAFKQLEHAQALEDGARARAVIEQELRHLQNTGGDWAEWDDAYAFADSHDPAFIQTNFGDWRVLEKTAHFNFCIILDRTGQVLYRGGYDSELGGEVTLAMFSGAAPTIQSILQPVLEKQQPVEGLLRTEHGLLLLVARPILTTQGSGPSRGMIVFGRFLDAPLLQALKEQMRVAFALLPVEDRRLQPDEQALLTTLKPGVPVLRPGPGGAWFVYEAILDLAGQPVALIRTPVRQTISTTAQSTSRTLVGVLGLTALAFLLGGAVFATRAKRSETAMDAGAWGTATLALLIGLALTAGLSWELARKSREELEQRFQTTAAEWAGVLLEKFKDNLYDLDAVRYFYSSSSFVSRTDFRQFVTPILDHRGFQTLEWLPRVPLEKRAEYEVAARADGLEGFQFTERDNNGALVRASDRPEYFPVYYLEPYAGNKAALGYAPDFSHPGHGKTLARAQDSGQFAATGRYSLVQEREQQFAVIVFAPVYAEGQWMALSVEERRQQLRGFVAGSVRIGTVIENVIEKSEPQGLWFRLLDLSAEDEQQQLYAYTLPPTPLQEPTTDSQLMYRRDFPFAGRQWRVEIRPNADFLAHNTSQMHRWVFASGLLFTVLLTLYLYTLTSQRRRSEVLVAMRTAELRASEDKFRSIVENAPLGFHLYHLEEDDRLVFIGANAAADRILKVRNADFIGKTIEAAFPSLVSTEIPAIYRRLARAGGVYTWSQVGYRDKIIVASAFEVAAFQTAPMAVAVTFADITERKQAEAALRASEERFRALHEASFGGISIHDQGVILECNQGLADMTGFSMGELIGMDGLSLIVPAWRGLVMQHIRSGHTKAYEVEGLRKDGAVYPLEICGKNIPYQDRTVRVAELRDITERKRAEEHQRLAVAVFEAARESIIVTDAERHIVAVNPAFTDLTGYSEAEALGKNPRFLQSGRQAKTYYAALWQTIAREGSWQGEFWNRRKDGRLYAVLATISEVQDAAGQITHYVGMATDITTLKEAEQRIEHLAYYDALTDLPNRALLTQRAELALALAARRREELAMLFLDLDRFKEVNDSLGHAEGDALLVQAATQLQALIRETDTVCRLGGDEFVLLLPDVGQDGALRAADKILATFRQPFVVAGHNLRVTASIGIALYPHDGGSFDELLKNADAALYRAKQDGRNTRAFYAREMNVATFERLMLETELRKAIEGGQLRAYFQPKVRLANGRLAGAEALVRWLHPDHGLIPPGRFIPVAEASDLIVALGDWVLEEVCRQLAVWREAGLPPLTVAVNLAARHFREPKFVERLQTLLTAHGLMPQLLELELTESTLLETGARTVETLLALRRLGVGLAIDDFGTGYSSLGYLKRLPITALKIDQSFVRDLVTDPDDRILAATIVALGHSLGLEVVAEGVETEEQRRILLEQGCDLAQGYFFSRPTPAEEFSKWLGAGQGGVASEAFDTLETERR